MVQASLDVPKLETPLSSDELVKSFFTFLQENAAVGNGGSTTFLSQIGESLSLNTLRALQKLTPPKDRPAWLEIIRQEGAGGAGGYKGCDVLISELKLSDSNLFWVKPVSENTQTNSDKYYLVKNMLKKLLREVEVDGDWEKPYPTVQSGEWQEAKPRGAMVRLVIGQAPKLGFVDVPLDWLQKEIDRPGIIGHLVNYHTLAGLENSKITPLQQWFVERKRAVPCLAFWLHPGEENYLPIRDPRMSIAILRVANPTSNQIPVLPKSLTGQFAHSQLDGRPAAERLAAVWSTVLADKKTGFQPPDINKSEIASGIPNPAAQEIEPPENPFRKPAFMSQGCEQLAAAVRVDKVTGFEIFTPVEMTVLRNVAKLLGVKLNSVFMASLLGLTGFSPLAPVAPTAKFNYNPATGRQEHTRIELVTFGNALYFKSPEFRALIRWVTNSTQTTPLPELLGQEADKKASTFGRDFIRQATLYQKQLELAQASLGLVTYFAKLTGDLRSGLEALTAKIAPRLRACLAPMAQFSALGAQPEVGKDVLQWSFESAFSGSAALATSLLGNELVVSMFLDNSIILFDAWQAFLRQNNFLPDYLLRLSNQKTPSPELDVWLKNLIRYRHVENGSGSIDVSQVPVVIGGTTYTNIHAAIHEAGKDAGKLTQVSNFLEALLAQTAQYLTASSASVERDKMRQALEQKAQKFAQDMALLAEVILYITLIQSGHKNSDEATTLAGMINLRKQTVGVH